MIKDSLIKGKISPRVIERLTRYLRCLESMSPDDYISSEEMADKMGLTAAQIRKDLSNFISEFGEGFGVRGKGYQVRILYSGIERILGVHKTNNIIIIGAGRLGSALLSEPEFTKESFNVIGIFDSAEHKVGREMSGLKIRDINELDYFLETKDRVDIAILTVPKSVVQDMADKLTGAGVKSLLNFAPLKIKVPDNVVVSNIDLYAKLQELNYWKEKAL